MASGGFQPNKQGKPEPKRRSNWQRSVSSDRDDAQSLNSLPSDMRINNWDLSDLRPTNLGGDSKRRKKSKGNPEREREQSLSVDSPPHDQKHHTPSSYPRTKMAPGTPTSQRVALENLKQHMTFSDLDDQVSTDGERNNERHASHGQRRRLHNASFNHADLESDRVLNRNNNMDYASRDQDSERNEMIARLMQIKDFMNQARCMLDSMERLGDRIKAEDVEKVHRLIRNLKEQEQGYRALLQNTYQPRDDEERGEAGAQARRAIRVEVKEDSDDETSVDLEVKTENSETSENSQESRPRIESKLGIESEEDGDQRESSTARFAETLRGASAAVSSASAMANANTSENATMSRSPDLDNTLVPGLRLPIQESDDRTRDVVGAESESPSLQHQELLKILKEKQQQLQALMGRQEELNLKRRETEKKLLQAQARDNKARAALTAATAGREFVEQHLAAHQTQSLLEAVTATSAAQAAATAAATAAALEERQDHQLRQHTRKRDNEDRDRDDDREEDDGDDDDNGEERGAVGESRVLKSNIVGYDESDDEDNSNVRELGAAVSLPNDLQELKRQLNFLRNEFTQVSEAPKNMGVNPLPSLDDGRQQLQNKLQELQNKRSGMDKLLQELQMIHSQPLEHLRNNGSAPPQTSSNSQNWRPGPSNIPASRQQQHAPLPPPPPPPPQTSQRHAALPLPPLPMQSNVPSASEGSRDVGLPANLQACMNDMATPTSNAVDSALATFAQLASQGSDQQQASAAMDPLMVAEVQEKLRRLKEVRGQLDQLRGLVQYYQNQRDELDPPPGEVPDENGALLATGETMGSDPSIVPRQSNPDGRNPRPQTQEEQTMRQQSSELQDLMRSNQKQQQAQQRRQAEEAGAAGGAASLQNMVQLLNLAGTDQGDEHSDEDNASVSQSDSQWSNLGPWDDDPEIQEKVKKLKAAKEKLRQLQDLVAFVQQSPDAARALPDNLGDLANSTEEGEGEAVSQATQTDEPNASVSEGEALSDSNQRTQQRVDEADGMDSTRAELERLRKERAMLLEIQSQLKQIQDQTEGVSATSEDRRQESRERQDEPNGDLVKPGQTNSNAPVVTFASNDELYSKMRRQRILREELRSKKKELEAIMKKDRNKRQYSRNQDNQSDTVSLNTDTFGITASVDATMATWGGSTVDNLENITEDEDGQERTDREDRNDDEEDDGYPSDGIVQVEEEEEENNSDNGTYTIEADARQRQSMRSGPMRASGAMGIGARPKTSRGRQTYPQPSYSDKGSKKPQRRQGGSRTKRNQREFKPRQENFRSAEDLIEEDETHKVEGTEWYQQIQDTLSTLTSSVEVLLRKSDTDSRQLSVSLSQENAPQGSSLISPMQEQLLQLQNQSMMLSFGQVVQSLTRQQGDMHQLQQQIQNLQLQVQEVQEQSFQGGLGSSAPQLFRPSLGHTSLNNSNFNLQASTAHAMSFNHPYMPSPFTQSALNNTAPAGFLGGFSPGVRSIQQQTGLGTSTGNLSTAGVDGGSTNITGRGGLGGGLSVNTVSSAMNTPGNHLSSVAGFVFNPLSQSTLQSQYSSAGQPHQGREGRNHLNLNFNQHQGSSSSLYAPHQVGAGVVGAGGAGSSASTMTRDFSQFINTLQQPVSSPAPGGLSPGQFTSGLFGASLANGGIAGPGASSLFPTSSSFLSSHAGIDDRDGLDDENPMPKLGSAIASRNKKRKYGSRMKKSESDPLSGPRMSTARSENTDEGGESGPGPLLWSTSRSAAYRSGADHTSGSYSGAGAAGDVGGADFDANSSYSSIQSIRDQHSKIRREQTKAKSYDNEEEANTLFDTLRDTIYTEVASLISQNESRPHFLLELFRDIRQVDSDFMRQRTLYAMQDLLRSRLKDDGESRTSNPLWIKATALNAADTANSEQTPSESMTSEDDEDLKVTRLQEEITAAERSRLARGDGFPYDYVEVADNPSSLSTPTNGAEDAPFFQDALGETVIGFDRLRLGEQERTSTAKVKTRKQTGALNAEDQKRQKARWGEGGFLASEQLLKDMHELKASGSARRDQGDVGRQRRYRPGQSLLYGATERVLVSQESQSSEVASSSAMDQASESSMSDMPYPRIDMKQLDRQIKAIMLETIPVVKEHMEDVCSSQLLAYIKRLVLSLTGQVGSQDFARFFHRQLASILEDTLQKYHGRKMRECGEDLLVEISDVLFNELAFFRLMQDLDDPNVSGRRQPGEWSAQGASNKESSSVSSGESNYSADEDEGDEGGAMGTHNKSERGSKQKRRSRESLEQRGFRITEADQEELGRERDDEMANQVRVNDGDEKEEDDAEHSYKIELAPSETKPFTRIGSDEDDDDGDEEQSMEDPSETAVSRDTMLETSNTSNTSQDRQLPPQQVRPSATSPPGQAETSGESCVDQAERSASTNGLSVGPPRPETVGGRADGAEKQDREKPVSTTQVLSPRKVVGGGDAAVDRVAAENGVGSVSNTNNNSITNDDDDRELTVDDLPDRLNVDPSVPGVATNSS